MRNVMPFYVRVTSSSRQNPVGVGLRTKQGFMTSLFTQRNQGKIANAVKVVQSSLADADGNIKFVTTVYRWEEDDWVEIYSYETT